MKHPECAIGGGLLEWTEPSLHEADLSEGGDTGFVERWSDVHESCYAMTFR